MNREKVYTLKTFLQLQIAVMLFGGAGLFAKLIPLEAEILIFGRTFWASVFLFLWLLIFEAFKISGWLKKLIQLSKQGLILAFHWIAFFKSIQLGSVALAVLTFSTFPLFTIFLAPIFNEGKIRFKSLLFAFITVLGIAVMLPFEDLYGNYLNGLIWGILSAISFALLTLLNKRNLIKYDPIELSFWQNLSATLFLLPTLFIYEINLNAQEHLYWILLGIIFTALSHSLFVNSLKSFSAQKAGLFAALEPVYSVLFAMLFLGAYPSLKEIIGGIIILTAVFTNQFLINNSRELS